VPRRGDHRERERLVTDQPPGELVHRLRRDAVDRRERVIEGQDPVMERLLDAEPRGEVPALLEPQLQASLGVSLGLGQLLGWDRLVADARELAQDRGERRAEVVGVDPGVDLEDAGVGVLGGERVDVVGESRVLADLQEEAAARPVAEQRVEQLQRPLVAVVARQPRDAEAEVRLRGVPLEEREAADGQGRGGPPARQGAVALAPRPVHEAHRLVVGQVACHGDDRVRGPVPAPPELPDAVGRQGPDGRLVPGDLPAERGVAEERLVEDVVDVLAGVVAVGADLLHDDVPLTVDVLVTQERPLHQLADDLEAALCLAHRQPSPVDRRFPVGRRVRGPTDALDGLRHGARRGVRVRSLEGQVLHEVGKARLLAVLHAGTREHVRRDRQRAGAGQARRDDPRPLGQRRPVEHHAGCYTGTRAGPCERPSGTRSGATRRVAPAA
jgi:hypothetical protein